MDEATIEDLAFRVRPWRGVDRSRYLSMREENDMSQIKDRGFLAYLMSVRAEFRDCRQGRMENGVKNLKGERSHSQIPLTLFVFPHGKKDAYI